MKQATRTFSSFLTLPLIVCCVLLSLSQPGRGANLATTSPAPADLVVQGEPFTTVNGCGNSSISDLRVISKRPQLQLGQTFWVVLTVAAVNRCKTSTNYQSLGVNLKLPAGVEIDPIPELSGCLVFRATNPSDSNTRQCHRTGAGDGFERVDPNGGQQWSLRPDGRNTVQIQLAVRSRTTGQKQFDARICDALGDVICEGDAPVANAIVSVGINVAAAPVVELDGVYAQSTSTTMILRKGFLYTYLSGDWRMEIREDGASEFTTVESGRRPPRPNVAMYRSDAVGLTPSTKYEFRFCFTPTFSTEVCTPIGWRRTLAQ